MIDPDLYLAIGWSLATFVGLAGVTAIWEMCRESLLDTLGVLALTSAAAALTVVAWPLVVTLCVVAMLRDGLGAQPRGPED